MLFDTSENDEDPLRGEDTATADTKDTESQKDLELAEREQRAASGNSRKNESRCSEDGFYNWNFSDRCD